MNILKVLTKRRVTGNIGEDAVRRFLCRNKYKIKAKNYVAEDYEIDIVAENKTYVCFVEVKTRTIGHEHPKEPRPASSVTPEKQRKIIAAALEYLNYNYTVKCIRFDVAEVFVDAEGQVKNINYIENAFTRDTAFSRQKRS